MPQQHANHDPTDPNDSGEHEALTPNVVLLRAMTEAARASYGPLVSDTPNKAWNRIYVAAAATDKLASEFHGYLEAPDGSTLAEHHSVVLQPNALPASGGVLMRAIYNQQAQPSADVLWGNLDLFSLSTGICIGPLPVMQALQANVLDIRHYMTYCTDPDERGLCRMLVVSPHDPAGLEHLAQAGGPAALEEATEHMRYLLDQARDLRRGPESEPPAT